jgi:hypothetical protein
MYGVPYRSWEGTAPSPTDVRVVWVGDVGGVLGLRVDLRAGLDGQEGAIRSTFLRSGQQEAIITLPPGAGNPLAYRWKIRWINVTSETLARSGEGRTQILVV